MQASRIRVLIVDDHPIVREGLEMLLSEEPDIEIAGAAADGIQALERAAQLQPDVILMDIVMPGIDGIQATRRALELCPACHILILTSFGDDARVQGAIQAGATGYLSKSVARLDLVSAIRSAAAGRPVLDSEAQRSLMRQAALRAEQPLHAALTPREHAILRLLARGNSNKEIARAAHLTEGTVKVYVSAILDKLGVQDRTQAALYAVKHGLDGDA